MNETVTVEELIGHRDFVRALARSLVRDPETADDVAQQTFAAALTNPPRSRAAAVGWLASVVRRLSARTHRDRLARARREAAAARPEAVPSTAAVVEREEVRQRLVRKVLALGEPYRSVVLLRYFEEAPPREIARRLGIPVETVRTRLKRALARLRSLMDRGDGGRRDAWTAALLPLAGGMMMGTTTKLAIAAAVLLLLAGGAALLLTGPSQTPGPPVAAASVPEPAPEVAPEVAPAPEPDEPQAPPEYVVRGRVVDEDGQGVAGVTIWISAQRPGGAGGKTMFSGEDGIFSEKMDDATPVVLHAMPAPHFEPEPLTPERAPPEAVTPPAEGVVLRGRSFAVGTVVVRVTDARTGGPIARAQVMVSQPAGSWVGGDASGEPREIVVRFPPDTRQAIVTVKLTHPRTTRDVSREMWLQAGGTVSLELVYPGPDPDDTTRLAGSVFDLEGRPVAGARVYAGSQMRMRGDEPFKPFRIERVEDAVKTDDVGAFELSIDEAKVVTVWHPEYSPVTVPVGDAVRIVLPPRATLRGRIVDAKGRPAAGIEVALDRARKATTGEDGRFSFDRVEAGARGLLLPGRYIVVRVRPGEEAEIEIPAGLPEVSVAFQSGGAPFEVPAETKYGGLLLGLDRVGGLHPLKVKAGDTSAIAKKVLPGRYLLLLSSGHVSKVDVDGREAVADFGTAALTVKAPAGTPIYVVPPDAAGELVRLLAGRAVFLDLPETGELRLAPLPAGRWLVGIDETSRRGMRDPPERIVEVPGTGTTVTLGE